MNYTLDRFPARERPEILEIVRETVQLSTLAGSLGRILEKISDGKKRRKEAQKVLAAYINNAQVIESEDPDSGLDLIGKLLGKLLKFIGKKIIKAIVRPILRFAGRMAMNILRIATRTILRFVIMPVFEAVVAFALANPVTASALALAALAGGGYYLYKKYFAPKAVQDINAPPEVDTSNVAEQATDVEEVGPQAYSETQRTVRPEVYEKSVLEEITTPIKNVARVLPFPEILSAPAQIKKKGKAEKFTGFGADVDGYIIEAARRYPKVPLDVLRGFIKMEAGWSGAMSPTGAIGTGQFIQPTWDGLAATDEGKTLGMTKIGKRFRTAEDPRYDKRINTLATAYLASENAKLLEKAKLPITGENLYMMHNIGPGIIQVMLGKPASDSTLLAMRQNGMTKNMTPAQFLAFQKGRFNQAFVAANSSTIIRGQEAQMAQSKTVDSPTKIASITPVTNSSGMLPQSRNQSTDLVKGPGNTLVRMQQ